MLSSIPLFGLPDRITVSRYASESDDGGGGLTAGDPYSIYEDLESRVCALDGKDADLPQGGDSSRVWRVIAKYAPDIRRQDFATVIAGAAAPAGTYTVIKVLHQRDDQGGFHHTSLIVEET